jgi:alpha-tubulin suppressor-like RCC1 family protein
VGGTLAGLAAGASVVLQNNSGNNLTINANGAFTFTTAVNSGAAYAVTVSTQPATQTCSVTNGSGTASANVTNIAVNCITNSPTTFTIGGTVSGLANGASVVLQNNAGNDLTVSANGNFTFSAPVNSGAAYAVTVLTQPSTPPQTCSVANGSGTASANVTNVAVTCVTGLLGISGTVSGLIGSIVLQNNAAGDQTISANGAFSFPAQAVGTAYAVTVLSHPTGPAQNCSVTNGSGTITVAVSNITVNCVNVDQTAPTITSRAPLPGVMGSKVQGSVVTVTFSEAVNTQTVNTSSFSVQSSSGPVSGEITFASGNTQAIFTPGSVAVPTALAFDESYTVTLTTAITDPSSNPLAANVSWSFNTGKKLAIGFLHTCARLNDGRVKCWGYNSNGQLGYNDNLTRSNGTGPNMASLAAVNLGAGRTAVAIAAGDFHTCAILDTGDAKCWGKNLAGALGLGFPAPQIGDSPNDMEGLQPINLGVGRKAVELAAGTDFTCARLDNDTVKCFGLNDLGQLGQGNTTSLGDGPGDIAAAPAIDLGAGLTPVTLGVGHGHVCVLLRDAGGVNHVRCWGDNQWGQLGRGNAVNIGDNGGEMGGNLSDVPLGTGLTPAKLYTTGGHNCAVLSNGAIKCWGLNTWGQLGLNDGNNAPVDRLVCAGPEDCIGDLGGLPGELGDSLPAAIAGNVAKFTVSFRHNCALLTNGQLKCWGSNEQGQLGLGDNSGNRLIIGDQLGEMLPANLATTPLKPGAVIEEITGGGFHTCVWNTDDTLNCWGSNDNGQLGHDDAELIFGDEPLETGANLKNTNLGS